MSDPTIIDDFLDAYQRHYEHGPHTWIQEQQTNHQACAWCNKCEDPTCGRGHYFDSLHTEEGEG